MSLKRRLSHGTFRIRLLGPLQLWHPNGHEVTPRGSKAQGLLALLVMAQGAPSHRAFLQDKLWSDRGQKQGRDSLKKALTELRVAFGDEAADMISSGTGPVRLNHARLSVDLFHPEDFDPTPISEPKFLEGLDIRDSEFNDWLYQMRDKLHERSALEDLEISPRPAQIDPARFVDPTTPAAEPMLGLAILPVETGDEDGASTLVGDMLISRIVNTLRSYQLFRIHELQEPAETSDDRSFSIILQMRCLVLGDELHVLITAHRIHDRALVWSERRILSLLELREELIGPVVSELSDQMVAAFYRPGALGNRDRRDAASLVMSGIDHVFRLGVRDVDAAMAAFDGAIDHDPRGSYFAWQAFLTAFQLENEQGNSANTLMELAHEKSGEALAREPHNPLVLSLLTHVYAFVLRDYERAFAIIDPIRHTRPDCVMFYDNLSMLHFYTGNLSEARRQAEYATKLGRCNPYRFSFETSLLMIDSLNRDFGSAIRHGERALAMQPTQGEVFGPTLRYLCAAYAQSGNLDAATRVLDRIITQTPDFKVEHLESDDFPVPTMECRKFLLKGIRDTVSFKEG
ncbi:MAG: hypothetical protein AAF636_16085 [Pseudomonadota bacterium]